MTQQQAIDEMYDMINATWKEQSQIILGYEGEVRWQGAGLPNQPAADKIWCAVSNKIVKDGQSAINCVEGQRKYTVVGLLFVQVFSPRSLVGGLPKARQLAVAVRDRFRKQSTSGQINFRDQKVSDAVIEPEYDPVNVVVTFEFDTIQ